MIKRLNRARFWRLLLILLGLTVGLAYLGAPRSHSAGAAPDQLPTVGFVNTVYTVNENQGPAQITVRVSAAPEPGQNVVVTYLTVPGTATEGAGGDYVNSTGTLTFTSSNQTTQSFNVTINNDNLVNEPAETINLILQLQTPSTATLGTSVAILTIVDDDVATATPRPTAATGTPIFVDLTEPNNTFEEAHEMQPDAAATCQLTLRPPRRPGLLPLRRQGRHVLPVANRSALAGHRHGADRL